MKDTFYFPHDYNAHNDPKLVQLAMNGWDLVGLYWGIIEKMHEQGGYLSIDPEPLSFSLRAQKDRIEILINFPGLFDIKDGKFTCERVLKNIQKRMKIKQLRKKASCRRWDNAKAMQKQCKSNPIKRKGKEIKEKKIKETTKENFPYFSDTVFKKTFENYLSSRKKKATDFAQELILKDLHKHKKETAIAMLEQSIKHGWQGVFPIKDEVQDGRRQRSVEQSQPGKYSNLPETIIEV